MSTFNTKVMSLDGYPLDTTIVEPDESAKGVFLLLHGCPSYKEEWGFYGNEANSGKLGMAEFLARNGYASIRFNFRGQGKDLKPEEMGELTLSGMINDVEAVYQFAVSHFKGCAVHVVGTSFAGGVSLLWSQSYEHKIENLFLMCPLLDMRDTLVSRGVIGERSDFVLEGAVAELDCKGYVLSEDRLMNRSFINEILASNVLSAMKHYDGPLHLFLATHDNTINLGKTYTLLDKVGKRSSSNIIEIPNAVHGFGPRKDLGYSLEERSKRKYDNWQQIYAKMLSVVEAQGD